MFVAPIVVSLSRLVGDRGQPKETGESEGGDESKAADDDEETKDRIVEAKPPSKEKRPSPRKAIRIRRVRQTKAKAKRRDSKAASPSPQVKSREAKKRLVRFDLKPRVDVKLGGIDPFGAFELPQDQTTDLALHHWAHVVQNTRMATNPRQPWMMINLSDKTLLSVTVYCSLNHFFVVRGQRCPPSYLPRKLHAIQNINTELQRMPSDHAVVAVAMMTLLECLAGEPSEWVVHKQGLQLMIRSRGGTEKLGLDGAAQRVISWADTCCAILLRTKPTLQPALIPNALEPAIPGFTIGNLSERLSPLTASSHLTSGILYIYLRLRYLTQFFTTIPTSVSTVTSPANSTLLDESFFSDKIDFIERAILALLSSEALAESPSAAFITAFLNAALIFVYEELREVPMWNNVSLCLSQRIRSGLELVELESVMACCPELLLWVLMLGRRGANPRELGARGRLWFDREIKMVEDVFNLEVPVNLKAIEGLNYFEIAEAVVANLRSGGKTDEEGDVRDEGG